MIALNIQNFAQKVGTWIDLAANRIPLEPDLYKNKQYYPEGYVVLDQHSLDMWSFRTIYDARAFLRMRLVSQEAYPNLPTLSFYTETSNSIDCHSSIRRINKYRYEYVGVVYMSHLDACYQNRINDGNLYTKIDLPYWVTNEQQ